MPRTGRKRPTQKQITALSLISKGMTPTSAMRKAGYSAVTARNPKANLLQSENLVTIIDRLKLKLEDMGVTDQYIAQKIFGWLESPNPKIQMGGYDRAKEILKIQPDPKPLEGMTRQFTFTEWVNDHKSASPLTAPTASPAPALTINTNTMETPAPKEVETEIIISKQDIVLNKGEALLADEDILAF